MSNSQLKNELAGLKKLVEKCVKVIEKIEKELEGAEGK